MAVNDLLPGMDFSWSLVLEHSLFHKAEVKPSFKDALYLQIAPLLRKSFSLIVCVLVIAKASDS